MNVCSEAPLQILFLASQENTAPPSPTPAPCHHAPRCHSSDLLKNVHVLAGAFCKSRHCTLSPAPLHLPALAVAASAWSDGRTLPLPSSLTPTSERDECKVLAWMRWRAFLRMSVVKAAEARSSTQQAAEAYMFITYWTPTNCLQRDLWATWATSATGEALVSICTGEEPVKWGLSAQTNREKIASLNRAAEKRGWFLTPGMLLLPVWAWFPFICLPPS